MKVYIINSHVWSYDDSYMNIEEGSSTEAIFSNKFDALEEATKKNLKFLNEIDGSYNTYSFPELSLDGDELQKELNLKGDPYELFENLKNAPKHVKIKAIELGIKMFYVTEMEVQ